MIDVVHAKVVEAHRHDVAVFAREGGEKAKRIAAVIFERTRSRSGRGARGKLVFDAAAHGQMLCPAPVQVNGTTSWNAQPALARRARTRQAAPWKSTVTRLNQAVFSRTGRPTS